MNKQKIFPHIILIGIIGIIVSLVLLVLRGSEDDWMCVDGQWVEHGHPSRPRPTGICGDGAVTSFDECEAAGYPVQESYPAQCVGPNEEVFVEDIGNELEKIDLIRVETPRPNQLVQSPVSVSGEARGNWFFEADFPIRVEDSNGQVLAEVPVQALGDWMTEEFVPFEGVVSFSPPKTEKGRLVFIKANPSGLPEQADELVVPIRFEPRFPLSVRVYFGNSERNPRTVCELVFPVEREIGSTTAIARAALEALLEGPTPTEAAAGYFTSLNEGVEIQRLVIENGVATVDFSARLEEDVGGSCRVAAMRAQITETLTQFPTVDQVVISVNGRTEDVLQP